MTITEDNGWSQPESWVVPLQVRISALKRKHDNQRNNLLGRRRRRVVNPTSGPSPLTRPLRQQGYGAKEQNRTADTAIFSRMLYLLSYLGVVGETGLEPVTPSV